MFHEGLKFPFGTPRIPTSRRFPSSRAPSLSLFGPELTWDSAVAIWQLQRSAAHPSKNNVTVAGNVRKLPNKTRRREPFQSQLQTCVCMYIHIHIHAHISWQSEIWFILAHKKCGEELNSAQPPSVFQSIWPLAHVDIGGGGLDQAWLRRIIAPPCTPETTPPKKTVQLWLLCRGSKTHPSLQSNTSSGSPEKGCLARSKFGSGPLITDCRIPRPSSMVLGGWRCPTHFP